MKRQQKKSKKETLSHQVRIHFSQNEIKLICKFASDFMGLGDRNNTDLDDLQGELSKVIRLLISLSIKKDMRKLVSFERVRQQTDIHYLVSKIATNIGQINRKMEDVEWLEDLIPCLDNAIKDTFGTLSVVKYKAISGTSDPGKYVFVRVPDGIWRTAMQRRGASSCSDIIRAQIINSLENVEVIGPIDDEAISKMSDYVMALGNKINHIAHRLNSGEHVDFDELLTFDPNYVKEDIGMGCWDKRSLERRENVWISHIQEAQRKQDQLEQLRKKACEASGKVYLKNQRHTLLVFDGELIHAIENGIIMANSDTYEYLSVLNLKEFDFQPYSECQVIPKLDGFKVLFGQKLQMIYEQRSMEVYAVFTKKFYEQLCFCVYNAEESFFYWLQFYNGKFYFNHSQVGLAFIR